MKSWRGYFILEFKWQISYCIMWILNWHLAANKNLLQEIICFIFLSASYLWDSAWSLYFYLAPWANPSPFLVPGHDNEAIHYALRKLRLVTQAIISFPISGLSPIQSIITCVVVEPGKVEIMATINLKIMMLFEKTHKAPAYFINLFFKDSL